MDARQCFVVIIHLHFHSGALFVNPWVVRLDFDRLSVILDGLLKELVLCKGVSASLIDGGEIGSVFAVESGCFAKQLDGFVDRQNVGYIDRCSAASVLLVERGVEPMSIDRMS